MAAQSSGHKISAVIPTLNEEATVARIIEGCTPHVDEIIVVDGHSIDRTRQTAEELGVKVIQDHGKGKGEAIRYSINQVTGDIIVFIDADGSHNPGDIPKLIQPIIEGRADHVSGSRLIGGSSELHGGFDECFRLMGSSFVTACINWKFKVRLSESQNGFRAIKTDVIRQLGLKEDITTIEQEMIIKTLKKGYRMAEIPSHENERTAGYSKICLRKVWFRYIYSLAKYLFSP
ncbi:MAG: glycosyltransferase family 2 protein [Thermodesulfobacteriota bacterium]|nr:glycosyltransferase family 2 protein [Thermodesulfobacteriota bacterium]